MSEIISSLHRRSDVLSPDALVDIVTGLACAESLWEPYAQASTDHRRTVRLLATDIYEVWVLSWAPGQGVSLHDHGPSAGALMVLRGELTEITVAARELIRETLPEGSVQTLEVGLIHDVINASDTEAVSLHVYSPPLSVMGIWDEQTLTRVGFEVVDTETPVLAADAA